MLFGVEAEPESEDTLSASFSKSRKDGELKVRPPPDNSWSILESRTTAPEAIRRDFSSVICNI